MQIGKNICCFLFITLLLSCNKNENKIKSFSQAGLALEYDGEMKAGNEVCFYVYFKDKDTINKKILNAYFNCDTKSIKQIDNVNFKISQCNERLEIEKNIVLLYITLGKKGVREIPNITVLYSDENKTLQIADTVSFPIKVE